jgi:hypothetical protein
MWLLFVPVLILVVLAVSVWSVFAGVFWVLGSGWPWLLIALGAWMFLHEDGRHRHRNHRRGHWNNGPRAVPSPTQTSMHTAPQPQPQEKAAKSGGPRPLPRTELPIDVQVKVEQIRRKVEVLLSYADRFPPFSKDLYLVRQTATDYLPRTIDAYLALTSQAAEKPLSTDGKNAHQELKTQLDLLDSKLDEIALDLERQDTDRLLANRRFLEDRFGVRDSRPDGVEAVS